MASLIQSKGSYYAQFFDASRRPKRKQIPLKTKRRRVAERAFRRLEDEYALGQFDPWAPSEPERDAPPRTLGKAYDAFMGSRANLRPHTLAKYESVVGLFVRELGEGVDIALVQPKHVQSFLDARDRRAITKKTYATTLSPFFNWAVEVGAADSNPVCGIRLERPPAKFPRYLSRSDVDLLVTMVQREAETNPHVSKGTCLWIIPVIKVNVYLGLRAGELCNLRWEDVDLNRGRLVVRNRDGFSTKSGKERTLPISDRPREVLQELAQAAIQPEGRVFRVSSTSGALRVPYLSRRFKRYVRLAGLPDDISFHTTRHTSASWLAEAGCSVEAIRMYLGHSSVIVTQRYMHLSPDALGDQVRRAFNS